MLLCINYVYVLVAVVLPKEGADLDSKGFLSRTWIVKDSSLGLR